MSSKSYGSWTIAVDVAGRVARERAVPLLTTAAVAIPAELLKQVSRQVRTAFPGSKPKWSEGGLPFLAVILKIVERYKLPVEVLHITGIDGEAWTAFWDGGERVFKQLSQQTKGGVGFAKSADVARMILCSLVFSRVVIHLLQLRGHRLSPRQPLASIDLNVAHDSDIERPDTIEIISEGLSKWAELYAPRLGLKPNVQIAFTREEAQPLVLLADYTAGSFYAVDPHQRSASSDVPGSDADEPRATLEGFRRRHGSLFREDRVKFSQAYPMAFRGRTLVRRRELPREGG